MIRKGKIFVPAKRRQALRSKPIVLLRKKRIPYHHLVAKKGSYSFRETSKWKYADKRSGLLDLLKPSVKSNPHLVLCDKLGTPRFTLSYTVFESRDEKILIIYSIQRERTKYKKFFPHKYWSWDNNAETKASKDFQKQLGGIHPSEFLLLEFLHRHKKEINAGAKVYLEKYIATAAYSGLEDRFFRKNNYLSMEKKRVQRILAD